MKIIEKKRDLQAILAKIRDQHQKIGLIPTMGSIHEGHLSLVKKSNNLNFYSLVTIFINPTQFNNRTDYLIVWGEKLKENFIKTGNLITLNPFVVVSTCVSNENFEEKKIVAMINSANT